MAKWDQRLTLKIITRQDWKAIFEQFIEEFTLGLEIFKISPPQLPRKIHS